MSNLYKELQVMNGYFHLNPNNKRRISIACILQMRNFNDVRNILLLFYQKIKTNLKMFRENLEYPMKFSLNFVRGVLGRIFPRTLFGSNHNFKKFFNLIIKLCTGAIYEKISINYLLAGWRIKDVGWLAQCKNKKFVLTVLVMWLITVVKIEVIRKLYFVQCDRKSSEVHFYNFPKYYKFQDLAINKMVQCEQLIPLVAPKKENATLKILLTKHGYRPILKANILRDKTMNAMVRKSLKNKGLQFDRNIFTAWAKFVENAGHKSLYGVKLDLKDAFSNVNIGNLITLVQKYLRGQPLLKHEVVEGLENQIIKINNKYYIWNRGLMQGVALSTSLCVLDRAVFDERNLKHLITETELFHRTVDDYLYCSPNRDNILKFMEILEKNVAISMGKTETNIHGEQQRIVYSGRIFNLQTKEIEIYIDPGLTTFRFQTKSMYNVAKFDSEYVREVCSIRNNNYHFSPLLLNLTFNSKETVLNNYFKAMLIISFKLDCCVKERYKRIPNKLYNWILKIIRTFANYTVRLLAKNLKEADIYLPTTNISQGVLYTIGVKAFLLVLNIRSKTYEEVIPRLKKVACYKNVLIGNKFQKMPVEFKNIRTRRLHPKLK